MAHIRQEFAFRLVAEFRGLRTLAFEFSVIALLSQRQLHVHGVKRELAVKNGGDTNEAKSEGGYGANSAKPEIRDANGVRKAVRIDRHRSESNGGHPNVMHHWNSQSHDHRG